MSALRSAWALWFLVLSLVSFGCPCKADALGYEAAERLHREISIILSLHPRYVWGGSECEAKGLDCSGMIFLAARRAGFPVRRTTALRMYHGDAGWKGYKIAHGDHQELDLMWWTFKPTRPFGHVGIVFGTRASVVHASSSSGYTVRSDIAGAYLNNISGIKRLSHGEDCP